MLILAHQGITLGVAKIIERLMERKGWYKLQQCIDYRVVLIGSMLPDIIDKPLGGIILRNSLGNGRIYSHTLLFLLLLFCLSFVVWRKYKRRELFILAGTSLFHDILDGMWFYPGTLLWPVYGLAFPNDEPGNWVHQWLELLARPGYYVPEIIGGIILLNFIKEKVCRKYLHDFVRYGKW